MPYVIGQSEIFLTGVGVLIVGLLILRVYLARKIKRNMKNSATPDQQP